MDFERQILVLIWLQMLFEVRYKTHDYFRYFLYLFSVPSFIFSKNGMGFFFAYPQKIVYIIHYLYLKYGFLYGHSIQYKMLLVRLHVYRSIKTNANKLFENSDVDLSWLLF